MSELASGSGRARGTQSSILMRGFLPGLVLGIVIGAVVGFFSTEIIGKRPKFEPSHGTTAGAPSERDSRDEGGLSREDLERMAREAQESEDDDADTPSVPEDDG